jgi:hypothetical protein
VGTPGRDLGDIDGGSDADPDDGPTRRSVTVSRSIATTPADLWAAISAPGNLEYAHPFCAQNPVTAWPGSDARDEVHYLSGWIYRREFTDWIEGVGYDLRIGSSGEDPSEVSWRITSGAPGRAELTITIQPRPLDQIPRLAQCPVQLAYVRPLLRRYLTSVVRGFEWWVTTAQPVPDNQFGRHPWFSERR